MTVPKIPFVLHSCIIPRTVACCFISTVSFFLEPKHNDTQRKSETTDAGLVEKKAQVGEGSFLGTALPGASWGADEKWRDAPVTWVGICSESLRRQDWGWGHCRFHLSQSFWGFIKWTNLQDEEKSWGRWRRSALNGRWAKSVLLFHIGGGEPAHLRSSKTGFHLATCRHDMTQETSNSFNISSAVQRLLINYYWFKQRNMIYSRNVNKHKMCRWTFFLSGDYCICFLQWEIIRPFKIVKWIVRNQKEIIQHILSFINQRWSSQQERKYAPMERMQRQTYPPVHLSLPPPGQLGVHPDDVSLQQGELLCISGGKVIACNRHAHHPGRKHWEKRRGLNTGRYFIHSVIT